MKRRHSGVVRSACTRCRRPAAAPCEVHCVSKRQRTTVQYVQHALSVHTPAQNMRRLVGENSKFLHQRVKSGVFSSLRTSQRDAVALNESVSLCLGIACLACILACVSCGSNDPEGASLGMKSKSAAADSPGSPVDFRPDGAVVVCRDLAGYFRDCGCSGEAGGVAKIPAAALHPGFLSPMFIGNSVVPPVASKDEAALLGELPLIVTATRLVWGAFPHVYWIPGESQPVLEVLLKQDTGLGQYVVKSPIQVGPLIIEISNDSIERDLIVVNGVRVNLPKMPRGREVLVLAWWNEPHPDKSKNAATA